MSNTLFIDFVVGYLEKRKVKTGFLGKGKDMNCQKAIRIAKIVF